MNGRRKPRQPRRIVYDVVDMVRGRNTRLMPHEIAAELEPILQACLAFRQKVITATQYALLEGRLLYALAIEQQGIARGIQGHLVAAQRSLHALHSRATTGHVWHAPQARFEELEDLDVFVWLHEWQLGQLSAAELQAAHRKLVAQIRGAGNEAISINDCAKAASIACAIWTGDCN